MTKLNIGLESAYDTIVNDYDLQTLNEIVNHGCQSGVCSQHIYYADTIKFFDNYEEEITDYIITNYGSEILADIFLANDCNLDRYKNDATWCYIELVASHIIDTTNEVESDAELVLVWSHIHYYLRFILKQEGGVLNTNPLAITITSPLTANLLSINHA